MDSRGQCSVDEQMSDVAYELTQKCGINHLRKHKSNLSKSHDYHSAPDISLWRSSSGENEFSTSRSFGLHRMTQFQHDPRYFTSTQWLSLVLFKLRQSMSAPHLKGGGYNLILKTQQSDPLTEPKQNVLSSKTQPNWAATIDGQPGAQETSTLFPSPPFEPRRSEFRHQPPQNEWPTGNTTFRRPHSPQNSRRPAPDHPGDRYNPDRQGNVSSEFANSGNREISLNDGQDNNMHRLSTVDFSVPPPMYHGSDMRTTDDTPPQPPIQGYPLNPTNAAQNFPQPSDINRPGEGLQNEPFGVGNGPANNTGDAMPFNYYPGNFNTPTMPMYENQGVRYAYPGLLSNGSDAQQNPYPQASMGYNIAHPAPGYYPQHAPMGWNTSSPGMDYTIQVPGVPYRMQNSTLVGFLSYPIYATPTAESDQVAEAQSAGQFSNYGYPNSQPAGNEQQFQSQELPTGGGPVQYTAPIDAQQLYYPARPIAHPVHGMGFPNPCHDVGYPNLCHGMGYPCHGIGFPHLCHRMGFPHLCHGMGFPHICHGMGLPHLCRRMGFPHLCYRMGFPHLCNGMGFPHLCHGMGFPHLCHDTQPYRSMDANENPVSTSLSARINNGNPSANDVRIITKEQWESYGRATGNLPTARPDADRNELVDNGIASQPEQENALSSAPQPSHGSEGSRSPQGAEGPQDSRSDEAKPRQLRIWEPTDAELEAMGCVKRADSIRKYIPLVSINAERTEVDDLLKIAVDYIAKLDMTDHLDKEKEKE